MNRLFSLVFIQLLLFQLNAISQTQKSKFEIGLYYFKSGDYQNAISTLVEVSKEKNTYAEVSSYLLISSDYYLGNFDSSIDRAESFKRRFPSSDYLFEVIMTQSIIYFETKRLDKLIENLKLIANIDLSKSQQIKLDSFVGSLVSSISNADSEKMFRELSYIRSNKDILKLLYQNAINEKDFALAKEFYIAYQNSSQKIDSPREFKVGVLFPLGDETKLTPSVEILEGIKFIVHNFNKTNEEKISLVVLNTEGDEKEFERNLKKLVSDPDIICVIGPIYSELLRKVSLFAEQYFIPMISPTSTSTNLVEHRNFVLQFNPNYAIRGSAMAEYCVNKLGLRKIAVLTQNAGFSHYISTAFIERARAIGIDHITEQIFDGTISNINTQLINLRKKAIELDRVIHFKNDMPVLTENKLMKLGLNKNFIDSLKQNEEIKSVFELFGKYGDVICESEGIKTNKRSNDDILRYDLPIYSLDGIYLSISDRSVIKNFIPHLKSFGIRSNLFGSDALYAPDDLLFTYPSSDGIIFTSDFFIDEKSDSYLELMKEFNSLSNLNLTRNVYYGIETILKLSSVIKSEKLTRVNLVEILQKDNSQTGISSQIELDDFGINNYLNILQFSNRTINKIDQIVINSMKGH